MPTKTGKHARDVTSADIKVELAHVRSQPNITLFDIAAAFGRTRPMGRKNSKHGLARVTK